MLISCWQCINNCNTNYKRLVISIISSDQKIFFWKWIYEVLNTFISKNLIQIEKIIIKFCFKMINFVHAWTMYYGWICFVLCAKIKSSQVIKSNSFHYLSQPPTDFTITNQFYIENIYNAIVSSLADLLALLFAREEMMDVFCALCQNKIKSSDKVKFISLSIPTTHWLYHYPSIFHWKYL